ASVGSRQSVCPPNPAAFNPSSQSHTVVIAPSMAASQLPSPGPHSAHPRAPPVCAAQSAAAAVVGWHSTVASSEHRPAQLYVLSTSCGFNASTPLPTTVSFFSHSRLEQPSSMVTPWSTRSLHAFARHVGSPMPPLQRTLPTSDKYPPECVHVHV